MSTEETTPAVEPTTTTASVPDASSAKPASRTRPTSSVDPKKKVARPSTGGAKKASFGGSAAGGSRKAAADPNRTYSPGDIVLARLKGFPPWPARIADPDDLSQEVKKAKNGRASNLYAVEFFPVGDFSWLPNREIQPLSKKEIEDFLSGGHRKASGDMKQGYEIARDPTEWDVKQRELRQQMQAPEEDELEDEDEDEDTDGKKRKKASKSQPKAKKPKKNGLSKAEVEDEDVPAKKSNATKSSAASKAKAKPVSKPENQAAGDDDPLSQDPECVKVKDWRHKLQRAFLGKSLPEAKEMDSYDSLFKTIEEYKDITVDALTYSKIGKVMKKIATLTEIPRNDDLKITDRASKLMQDWQNVIAANGAEASNGETKPEAAEEPKQSKEDPAVNGTGEGEASAEKTEADTKMDVEPTPA